MATGGSSIYKGSDLIHDYSCSKCEENDLNTEATHFCPECKHYLCDKCVNLHNGYHNKHTVYGRGDIQKWAGFSMDRCDLHVNKLEVHCDDHQELCCSVCVALSHRLCSSISHLPDLARGILDTAEFKQLPIAVDQIRSRLDEIKNASMKDQASLKVSYKNIIAEIKALRNEINKVLDKLEKKTFEELDSLMEDLEKSIEDDMKTCAHMNNQLKSMTEKLKQVSDKHKETSSYIGFRICQTKLREAKSIMQEIQIRPTKRINFISNGSVLPFLRNINSLGDIDSISMPNSMDRDHVYKTQSSSCYSVRIKEDDNDCHIVGICELPSGEFVIADHNNSRVKLLNNLYQVTDHCDLPEYLQGMCLIASDNIAVAVEGSFFPPCTHEIHFLSVTRGKLQKLRMFTTDHECISVAHHQGQLYVTSRNALYQYTMDGQLVKKIYKDITSDNFFTKSHSAVSGDGKIIYVTFSDSNALITLEKGGQVLSTLKFPELQLSTGLCVCPSGHHVFVCLSNTNTVLQVDREGRKKLATVALQTDNLKTPVSVCFIEHTSSLIVGNNVSDNITVVKLC